MKQRIAVVAASALTAGFLSVVAMPVANATESLITRSGTINVTDLGIITDLAGLANAKPITLPNKPNLSCTPLTHHAVECEPWVCRPKSSWDIHHKIPLSRLQWVENAGHGIFETPMVDCMVNTIHSSVASLQKLKSN